MKFVPVHYWIRFFHLYYERIFLLFFKLTGCVMAKKHEKLRRRDKGSGTTHAEPGLKKYKHDYSRDYSDKSWPYHRGKMDLSGKIVIVVIPIAVSLMTGYFYYLTRQKELVRTPLPESNIINKEATSAAVDPERFWGTYRSNMYFGMKTRSPKSPVFGLLWLPQMNVMDNPTIRHWCDQGDGIPMYGWFAHDGINFGIQEIFDRYYTVSTEFVKRPGGIHGGDWTARFRVNARQNLSDAYVSLFFYAALDGQGQLSANIDGKKHNHLRSISGMSDELGNFELIFPKIQKPQGDIKYNYYATYANGIDQLKEKVGSALSLQSWKSNVQYVGLTGTRMPQNIDESKANFIVHQVTAKLPFDMEVLFESGSYFGRNGQLIGNVYNTEIRKHLEAFDHKFEETFGLKAKGLGDEYIQFSKAALSNMLGSIGYFYGSSLVKSKHTKEDEVLDYWKAPLYTGVPSRSFFPRGFLWDEGFHNILIEKWDPRISMDIIGHWLDLMNVEGWIPREQILGSEARSRTPAEFVVQHNQNANPPTLFLPLQKIVKNLIKSNKTEDKEYLKHLFPRLKAWYDWFNTTQVGPRPFTYTWKGRNPNAKKEINPKTLSSGLDDYPRASHPSDQEYHVDLRCWMALASGVMEEIAKSINQPWESYHYTHKLLTDTKLLDELHWSRTKERYCDYGLHTDSVKLSRPKPPPLKPGQRPPPLPDKERVTIKEPSYKLVDSIFGYVSLFPFLFKIIEPESLKLGKILDDLKDPNLLWTKYGLRSLGKTSLMYNKYNTEHDPPYWRGNIWININYLTIGALHHYANIPGPYQETAQLLYKELRENVIQNLLQAYKKTGYIWENYSDIDGQGKGCHPFTGWSALVVAIMAEDF